MSIHLVNNFIKTALIVVAVTATFISSWSVVRAETIVQQPSLITRMSQSLGADNGMVLEAFSVKVPVFPRGYVYPIAQLGNCNNAQECFVYCEDPQNITVCATVASQQGYMSASGARKAIEFAKLINNGYLANCNTMNECIKLCDNVNVQADCQQLVASINNNASVLGAQDGDNFLGRSIFETCDQFDNCETMNSSGVLNNTYAQFKASGSLPSICVDGQQCFNYCLVNSTTSGCSQFVSAVGGVDISNSHVFKASNLSSGGLSYEQILNNQYDPEAGSGGGSDTGSPTTPQININDIQSCIYNNQAGVNETTITPDQYNRVNESNLACQERYTPEINTEQMAEQNQQKASSGISNISQCILASANITADISRCLSIQSQ